MNLANEVYKPFSRFWHSLFRPVSKLELPHCSGLAILGMKSREIRWEVQQKMRCLTFLFRFCGRILTRKVTCNKMKIAFRQSNCSHDEICLLLLFLPLTEPQWHKSAISLTTVMLKLFSALERVFLTFKSWKSKICRQENRPGGNLILKQYQQTQKHLLPIGHYYVHLLVPFQCVPLLA